VCLAMLAADRALTLDGVLATVAPMADYIATRRWPVAGAANLTDLATIRRTLRELVSSGVLTSYDGGTDTVWSIAAGKHLVAAFYRNTAIHMLVDRAIGELSLVAATEGDENGLATATEEALRLRDLLKFDFFFARRRDFAAEMATELAIIEPDASDGLHEFTPARARAWLEAGNPLVAPLVLRPFLDAYHLVADRLAAWEPEDVDESRFLDECLRVGRQWAMQGRLASEESVSLELFKPALRLARHRGLLDPGSEQLPKRRADFRDELRETVRRVTVVADLARRGDAPA
jgi:glycerol-3-phosphate O-acyltransferase